MNQPALLCPDLKLYRKGKVREVYDFGKQLLMVATDNISAFDVVLPCLIPGKGQVLTQISNFWFERYKTQIKNHMVTAEVEEFPQECQKYKDILRGRAVLVTKTEMIQFESIVRGYLSGSGYKDYKATGKVCGIELPKGLTDSAKLEEPLFTPSTKAHEGHDINISEAELKTQVDPKLVDLVKEKSLALYKDARDYAAKRGIIIADTKFEFGYLDGEVILIDEVLTPDSSRFWPANDYQPGRAQKSYDKQIIRDYLETLDWNKQYPGPSLPQSVIEHSLARYQEVCDKLKGPAL
ncbi:MAG: phosphoribosylaminoimidazolesuccinocarboxamide synthase [Candidatus Lambdaproteobacteria bacterium RIFOXYD2_FULL_50_16]|uniref:Phosphoribosylaminoimidazole-succinocarboxamide synthase n=1 Tax=Candidatus Lambdaproteobacteria bacterium RIFOXYD2_FULL_50_16 TaxID=1817772 RepID=A0A1F6G676_9PROT|nr:MAG: phosphoribosylaminoimidazolesuccinocarboxamide synthase [Candidatus Lambdaproteobacteria bacterium RIFOXYD2_FULL_50_16]